MIETPTHKNIFKYKAKIVGNFTVRQATSLTIAAVNTVLVCFLLSGLPFTIKCVFCIIPILLCLLVGFVEIQNEPIEKILPRIYNDNFKCKKYRLSSIPLKNTKPQFISVKTSKKRKKVK